MSLNKLWTNRPRGDYLSLLKARRTSSAIIILTTSPPSYFPFINSEPCTFDGWMDGRVLPRRDMWIMSCWWWVEVARARARDELWVMLSSKWLRKKNHTDWFWKETTWWTSSLSSLKPTRARLQPPLESVDKQQYKCVTACVCNFKEQIAAK